MLTEDQRERLRALAKTKSEEPERVPSPLNAYQQANALTPQAHSHADRRRGGLPVFWIIGLGMVILIGGAAVLQSSKDAPQEAPSAARVVAEKPVANVPTGEASPAAVAISPLGTFPEAVERVRASTGCSGKITPASDGWGPLYGCIAGDAEAAKLFVNGSAEGADARNIKVMWNQWTRDAGYGISADRAEAVKFANVIVQRYAPAVRDKVVAAFMSDVDGEVAFKAEGLTLTVRKSSGPSIREHLLTIEAGAD